MQQVIFQDLGKIRYKEAWDTQSIIHKSLVDRKLEARKSSLKYGTQPQAHHFLFCEHHPVYTLGKSGSLDHLLLSEEELKLQDIDFYKINRGGDITYHGPGQVVGYPIFDLDCFFTDVHKYVRYLEEAVIRVLKDYDVTGTRLKGYTGVWIDDGVGPKRKICAIGVHLSRWVSMHGFAFNVNTDLGYFSKIIPCGIEDNNKTVTSLEHEIGRTVDMEEIKGKLKYHFAELFGFQIVDK